MLKLVYAVSVALKQPERTTRASKVTNKTTVLGSIKDDVYLPTQGVICPLVLQIFQIFSCGEGGGQPLPRGFDVLIGCARHVPRGEQPPDVGGKGTVYNDVRPVAFKSPTMLANIVRNVRRGNDSGRLFEFANVFFPAEPEPLERKHISLGLWGSGDFFDLKGAFEAVAEAFGLTFAFERSEKPFLHPGITARVLLKTTKDQKRELAEVGWLGELHPAIAEELALEKKAILGELDYDAIKPYFRTTFTYDPVPAFPAVSRDLALVVGEEVTSAALTEAILRACRNATKAELFDVYRDARLGAGKKSMAVRITFAPPADKPLSPETVDGYVKKILSALSSTLSATLR